MKIVTVLGTRPEIIKLSRIIDKVDKYFDHVLVHTGQNFDYNLNDVFFEEMGIRKPDYYLDCACENATKTIAKIIEKTDEVLEIEKPDAFLIFGDTNSCFSSLAAKKKKIPIFHFEAGNRCNDFRVPEEVNRRIIDSISDINIVWSTRAKDNLLLEGYNPKFVYKPGSPMFEIINHYKDKIENSNVLNELNLKSKEYFVVSFHREENVENKMEKLLESLIEISEFYKKKIVFSVHPRTKKKMKELGLSESKDIIFSKPFGFFDYLKLQNDSFCVLSDSGTIMEESAIMDFPAIMLRETHERNEGSDEGILVVNPIDDNLIDSIKITIENREKKIVGDYMEDNVSSKIVNIIASNIHYVNTFIWRK